MWWILAILPFSALCSAIISLNGFVPPEENRAKYRHSASLPNNSVITFNCTSNDLRSVLLNKAHLLRPSEIELIAMMGEKYSSMFTVNTMTEFPKIANDEWRRKSQRIRKIRRPLVLDVRSTSEQLNLTRQANEIISGIKRENMKHYLSKWKLVFLFSSLNNICQCYGQSKCTVKQHVDEIGEVVEIIRQNLPQTLLAIVGIDIQLFNAVNWKNFSFTEEGHQILMECLQKIPTKLLESLTHDYFFALNQIPTKIVSNEDFATNVINGLRFSHKTSPTKSPIVHYNQLSILASNTVWKNLMENPASQSNCLNYDCSTSAMMELLKKDCPFLHSTKTELFCRWNSNCSKLSFPWVMAPFRGAPVFNEFFQPSIPSLHALKTATGRQSSSMTISYLLIITLITILGLVVLSVVCSPSVGNISEEKVPLISEKQLEIF